MESLEELAFQAAERARTGQGTQGPFEAIVDVVRGFPSQAALQAAVRRVMAQDRLAGQFVTRACRSIFSICELTDDVSLMLLAFPCVILKWNDAVGPMLQPHLQGWLQTSWLDPNIGGVRVAVASAPTGLPFIEATLGPTQALWARNLMRSGEGPEAPRPGTEGMLSPALWLAVLHVPSTLVDDIQFRLMSPSLRDERMDALKHRMETLAEESNASFTLGPPAAWAEAFSLARISAFWQQAKHWARQAPNTPVQLHFDGRAVSARTDSGHSVPWGEFPEETSEDLQRLAMTVSRALGVQVRLDQAPQREHESSQGSAQMRLEGSANP